MSEQQRFRLGVMWSGDRDTRRSATAQNNRLSGMFAALAEQGIATEPAVYSDDFVDEVRAQLRRLDGVLVWVDPITDGRNRSVLDVMLRDVAGARCLGQHASRRDPEDGREGGAASHEASRMGHRYPALSRRAAASHASSHRGCSPPARAC